MENEFKPREAEILVTPEYIVDRYSFHSAGIEMVDTRPAVEQQKFGPLPRNSTRGLLVIKLFVMAHRARENAVTRTLPGGTTETQISKSDSNIQQMVIYGKDRGETIRIFANIRRQLSSPMTDEDYQKLVEDLENRFGGGLVEDTVAKHQDMPEGGDE